MCVLPDERGDFGGDDVALECTGYPEAVTQGIQMVRRGGMYVVAGVFADVGAVINNAPSSMRAP